MSGFRINTLRLMRALVQRLAALAAPLFFCFITSPIDAGSGLAELQAAAERGDPQAQGRLADAFAGAEDPEKALAWYRKAAEQGDPHSQSQLGRLYEFGGEFVARDPKAAVTWYLKAAAQGDINAQLDLGQIYESNPKPNDGYADAFKWYTLAAQQKSNLAKTKLEKLLLRMNPAQIAEARRRMKNDQEGRCTDRPTPAATGAPQLSQPAMLCLAAPAPITPPPPVPTLQASVARSNPFPPSTPTPFTEPVRTESSWPAPANPCSMEEIITNTWMNPCPQVAAPIAAENPIKTDGHSTKMAILQATIKQIRSTQNVTAAIGESNVAAPPRTPAKPVSSPLPLNFIDPAKAATPDWVLADEVSPAITPAEEVIAKPISPVSPVPIAHETAQAVAVIAKEAPEIKTPPAAKPSEITVRAPAPLASAISTPITTNSCEPTSFKSKDPRLNKTDVRSAPELPVKASPALIGNEQPNPVRRPPVQTAFARPTLAQVAPTDSRTTNTVPARPKSTAVPLPVATALPPKKSSVAPHPAPEKTVVASPPSSTKSPLSPAKAADPIDNRAPLLALAKKLHLRGIYTFGNHQAASINDSTVLKGEKKSLLVSGEMIEVRCAAVKDHSVLVEVTGLAGQIELAIGQ